MRVSPLPRLAWVFLISLLISAGAFAADNPPLRRGDQNPIATTASIVKIDLQHRSFKVRSLVRESRAENEYTVVITDATQLRNEIDIIQFDDFKVGESLSIWGTWKGSALIATRISKWPE